MDTTTGMTSLQETLQTDRALLARGGRARDGGAVRAEAAVVQAAPVGGDDGGARAPGPVGAAGRRRARRRSTSCASGPSRTSSGCASELDAGLAPALAGHRARAPTTIWPARYEAELGLRQGPLTKLLGPAVVDDLAVVGSDPYLREGSDLIVRLPGARAARVRGGAGRHAGGVRRRARRAQVGDGRSPGNADHHHAIERRRGAPPPRDRRRVRRRVEQPGGDQAA